MSGADSKNKFQISILKDISILQIGTLFIQQSYKYDTNNVAIEETSDVLKQSYESFFPLLLFLFFANKDIDLQSTW